METIFFVNNSKIPIKSLQYKSKNTQVEVMRDWFSNNFEDPANSCPYESREGGYAYIYGGPYYAIDELQEMFGEYVKSDYIQELADELDSKCYEWSGNSNNVSDRYDEDLYEAVTSSEDPFYEFLENISRIMSIAKIECKEEHKSHLLGILYINVITALETLYVELFTKSVEESDSFIIKCIEANDIKFRASKKVALMPFNNETIESMRNELIKQVKGHLIKSNWHITTQVIGRFKSIFSIEVKSDWPFENIDAATKTRNDLIHRGGKNREGNTVIVTTQKLNKLIEEAISLGTKLNYSLKFAIQDEHLKAEKEF
jgi:hypothetical protein